MTDCPPDEPQKPWHPMIGGVVLVAMAAAFALGGYKVGVDNARVLEVQVPVEVPVPGPVQYVDVPVPGPTVVKKVFIPKPRHCPAAPSVADALNEYEAKFMIRPRSSR